MSRNKSSNADGHAILADRVFDGRGWHRDAAVMVRDGRIAGLASPGEVPSDWPQSRVPAGVFVTAGFIDLQVNGGGGVLLNDQPTRRRHARDCPGAPPLRHHGVPADFDHRYARTDAQRHCGGAFGGRPRRRSWPASGRPVHQPAAPGGAPSRPDRAAASGRPGAIVRACRCRPLAGDAGARMRSCGLCHDAGLCRRADLDRAQRGIRCRCRAGRRGGRNRRHAFVQCDAAIQRTRARHRRYRAVGAAG